MKYNIGDIVKLKEAKTFGQQQLQPGSTGTVVSVAELLKSYIVKFTGLSNDVTIHESELE